MQANIEFEEGEAFFCYKDDDDDNIDLDSLSYIDERIQHALGHFRKEFEGGISADRLGAKFGDYGSFLPTCECSPPLRSCPKTPQKHSSSPISPSNLRMVAAFQNSKAPPNIPPSMRLGTASYKAPPFRNIRVPSVDDSVKNTDISSNEVIEKFTLKDCANKSENLTDQRTLKLRIKVKSDILAKKNAAIYSGLGLDDSPSSSMEKSHGESEDMPHVSQETPEESPTSIVQVNNLIKHLLNEFYGSKLRFRCDPGHCKKLWENAADAAGSNCGCYALVVMTSFTIPGGVLISPLHDSLLYLIRKEKALGNIKPMYSLNGHQEHYSMSTDELDSFVGDGHLLKKRKVTVVDQSDKQHMNGNCSENYMTLHTKKKLGNRTLNRKDFLSNDLRCTPLSSSICDAGETAEVTVKAFEVSKEVDKDGVKCRMVSTKAVKEDTLESISGQDFDKIEKQNTGSSFMQKMEISQNNNSTDPKINNKCNEISNRIKCDAMKCKVDQDTQKCEINQEGKVKSESKNESKGERSPGKVMTDAEKDSIGTSNNAMVNDRKSTGIGVISSKSKMHKIKSMKDNKVTDCDRDSSKRKKSQHKVDQINPTDRPTLNKATVNSILDHVDKSAYRVNLKERPSGNKVVNQLSAGPCVKDAPGAFPIAENKPTSEMVPSSSAATPQVIEEDWVCCDSCQKWRLLPMGLKPEQLPEKWLCSMLYWLPGMNRCNISEEETTKALYASYQMPIFEGQSNMQNCATGPETGVRSVDALQLGLNRKKSSSDVMLDRGKKKHGINEKAKSGINNDMHQLSNTEKNNAQESVKNRSLNDMNKRPADSNRMKKSISKHSSRLNNLIEGKNTPKVKEKQMNEGDRNHVRLKRKMENNQHGSGTAKKSKTEDVYYADKQLNPSMEFKKVGLNSRNGLPTKASGKNMRKYDDYCWSDDLEDQLVVPVKKGDRAQFSSDDGSLDATNSSKSGSIKKRKMTDWLDSEKHNKTLSLEGYMQCGKEGNVNRREKKYIVLNMDAKSETERDDKLVRESGLKRVFSSDSRDEMAIGTEVKSVNKVQQPRKHKKNVASYQALDCFDPLGKDLGSGELSLAATSSSSKVSGSHKARTNLADVRGSPLESVTSSPLWTSNMDKRILAAGDTSEKNDARKRGLSKSLDNREGKLSVKMKERISYDIHPAHGNCGSGSLHEEKMNKSNKENALSWQKSGKVTSLRGKEKDRISGSEVIRDKMKVSASDNDFYKNGVSYESTVDPNHHASGTDTSNDVNNSSLKSNHKIANPSKKNSSRHWSNEAEKQTAQKQNKIGIPFLKVDATRSTNRKIISQQNLIQNFEEENKANQVCAGSRDGKAKVIASSEDKVKRETLYVGSRTAPESQKGDMSNGHPVHASGNDVPKFVRNPIDVSCKVGVNCSSESFIPDGQLSESGPVSKNSSQTASSILEEATKLKDSADHYKNSGFEFESNETYFKAALKFLHGASLLESSHSESSKHGETSQMQIYATTAKLFESCAHKYEKCQEMAAAALAYKCIEVVYMRLVYCKHSSINRDRHALQSTLQKVSQGESPSSSASDIDNLNNLAVVDKVTMTRGSNTHVANNQVISARNRPNIVRLLDFTEDINLAMEASRKCKSTYRAANLNMEESRNRDDCITSIRKVIDFSFQDVDDFVHLVLTAMKAITCAGLGGVRD